MKIVAMEECRCASNLTFRFSNMKESPAADAQEDLRSILRTFSQIVSASDFPELELPAETDGTG